MIAFPKELRHGSGHMMTLDPTRVLLSFAERFERNDLEAMLEKLNLVVEGDAEPRREGDDTHSHESINHTDERIWIRTARGGSIDQQVGDVLEKELGARLAWIGPVYRLANTTGRGGLLCPLPDVILVRSIPNPAADAPEKLAAALGRIGLFEVDEKSRYLAPFRYFRVEEPKKQTSYEIRERLLGGDAPLVLEARLENMPMVVPVAVVPTDTLYPQQWSMARIAAGGAGTTGWDLTTGVPGVVVAVLDSGCDLTHPDLNYSANGINLGSMAGTGAPVGGPTVRGHGTCCAGIVAGRFNNGAGVAGVAGGCRILPLAFQNWTDAECAAGINFAAANGALVISMSFRVYAPGDGFSPTGWDFSIVDPAITNAVNVAGLVLCAATGNEDHGVINGYPARNPLVMACGGSDTADNRKTNPGADGECWGSVFGPGVSVVAPCVMIPSTDIRGNDPTNGGYNRNAGAAINNACVNYPSSGDAAGDYFLLFNGTSSATPHVAGLAAAVRSLYPALTNLQVRTLIERTAEKVGTVPYADAAGFPNGTRNAAMGYGRINMLRALDQADTMIRDWSGDSGNEPSTPPGGNFWTFSDVVVRITDDNVFVPDDPMQASNVERGQTNYLYARVTNNGPREARNVTVSLRITPYVGLQFLYPADWTAVDANHVSPTPVTASFASIASGTSATAKFTVSSTQVESLWGWINNQSWHPCLLASVTADNDYAFATSDLSPANLVIRRNNLAQRNLSVINVLASASVAFPFIAGHRLDRSRTLELVIDRRRLPRDMRLTLSLDDGEKALPHLDWSKDDAEESNDRECGGWTFLDRVRIRMAGCCEGVLTLEPGSRFDCRPAKQGGTVEAEGGEVVLRPEGRSVEIREDLAVIRIERRPGQVMPLVIRTTLPGNAQKGTQYPIIVSQRDGRGETIGGATVIYVVR